MQTMGKFEKTLSTLGTMVRSTTANKGSETNYGHATQHKHPTPTKQSMNRSDKNGIYATEE